jgi:hypothetical protein
MSYKIDKATMISQSPPKGFLNRLFGNAEEISGQGRCPTNMYRWTLFKCRWFKLYLHKFVGNDWSTDLHDHPKRFVSFGLRGSYLEQTESGYRRYNAPWIRSFPADHKHRITTPFGNCWTLCIVFRNVRNWGFWLPDGKWMRWDDYVKGKGGHADRAKNC